MANKPISVSELADYVSPIGSIGIFVSHTLFVCQQSVEVLLRSFSPPASTGLAPPRLDLIAYLGIYRV